MHSRSSPDSLKSRSLYLLSQLIESGVESQGDAAGDLAVVCGEETITWVDLHRRVGQLAAALIQLGVKRGDRVGVYLHKSIESMVAVHGIWRAGAAYVPIDPLSPIKTVRSVLADCDIAVVVSHEPRRGGLNKLLDASTREAGEQGVGLRAVVGLELESNQVESMSWQEVAGLDPAPMVVNLGDDLAYIMYTSGSTGKPKGIMHTHRSGLAYATMAADLYGLTSADRLANVAPLHFDQSTFEFFSGIGTGSRVVLVPEPYLRVPASCTEYLSTQQVTTIYTVPSLLQALVSRGALDQYDFESVRWVLSGGEAFPSGPLREFMGLLPGARFANVYGPAEVNQCTHFDITNFFDPSLDVSNLQPVPLGDATADAELDLVDVADLESSIAGVGTGELLVRTSTMMAGYWGQAELTDASTLTRTGPGGLTSRWYRTGDLVERTSDGELIFLGRADNQVKVRGNRVELEVVEAAIGNLAEVDQVVVGTRSDADTGDTILVACCTLNEGFGPDIDSQRWRVELSKLLPRYAIPSVFEVVDGFGLTASGKIDRKAIRKTLAASPQS